MPRGVSPTPVSRFRTLKAAPLNYPAETSTNIYEISTKYDTTKLKCRQMADFDLSASFIPSLHRPSSLLPISRHRQSLLYLVETFPVTIVVGQTGSFILYSFALSS